MRYGQNKKKGNVIDGLLQASKKGISAVWRQQNSRSIYANHEQNVRTNYITQIITRASSEKLIHV